MTGPAPEDDDPSPRCSRDGEKPSSPTSVFFHHHHPSPPGHRFTLSLPQQYLDTPPPSRNAPVFRTPQFGGGHASYPVEDDESPQSPTADAGPECSPFFIDAVAATRIAE
ncbi:hypothetical protein ANO11243_029010 [Dothideomycetidae sp. 11243]|nr:hypothetical protein ANO11243_029010 [fungal sp. No.11243]